MTDPLYAKFLEKQDDELLDQVANEDYDGFIEVQKILAAMARVIARKINKESE